jgi:hypothetical protein
VPSRPVVIRREAYAELEPDQAGELAALLGPGPGGAGRPADAARALAESAARGRAARGVVKDVEPGRGVVVAWEPAEGKGRRFVVRWWWRETWGGEGVSP